MTSAFNRGTGLMIIDVSNSNPNGDPDTESDPRIFDDGRGLISPVSFKRKLRDLLLDASPQVRALALGSVQLPADAVGFEILEQRGRNRDAIHKLGVDEFKSKFWDGRVFGNTFIEKNRTDKIAPGAVQFAPGVSLARIDVLRLTLTNRSGVEEGKDRGMAPAAWRAVQHGLYTMPFFVNASAAAKSGCEARDIELMKFLIPHAYAHTASNMRSNVQIVHAWYAEHKTPLGSCPDPLIIRAMTPKKKDGTDESSKSIDDYDTPTELPPDVRARLASFEDLCTKEWPIAKAA